jgi:hypothetical protein
VEFSAHTASVVHDEHDLQARDVGCETETRYETKHEWHVSLGLLGVSRGERLGM